MVGKWMPFLSAPPLEKEGITTRTLFSLLKDLRESSRCTFPQQEICNLDSLKLEVINSNLKSVEI